MKRFTETEKWRDPWFRKLSPKLKCLWLYLCDNCDPAGVIDLDLELAAVQIGAKLDPADTDKFGDRLETLPSGKLWIRRFVPFQFGVLSRDCRPHKVVFEALERNGLNYNPDTLPDRVLDRVPDTLPARVPATLQEQDKEKDKDKTKGVQGETKPRKDRGTLEEVRAFAVDLGLPESDGEAMFHKWEGNGWRNGSTAIRDWRSTIRAWKTSGYMPSQKNGSARPKPPEQGQHGTIRMV